MVVRSLSSCLTDSHSMKMHAAIAADTDKYVDLDFLSQELQLLCALTGAVLPVAKLSYVVHNADWSRQERNTMWNKKQNILTTQQAARSVKGQSKPLGQVPVRDQSRIGQRPDRA